MGARIKDEEIATADDPELRDKLGIFVQLNRLQTSLAELEGTDNLLNNALGNKKRREQGDDGLRHYTYPNVIPLGIDPIFMPPGAIPGGAHPMRGQEHVVDERR